MNRGCHSVPEKCKHLPVLTKGICRVKFCTTDNAVLKPRRAFFHRLCAVSYPALVNEQHREPLLHSISMRGERTRGQREPSKRPIIYFGETSTEKDNILKLERFSAFWKSFQLDVKFLPHMLFPIVKLSG